MAESNMRWLPLESNPDVINKYMSRLGVPDKWQCVDVLGLDAELLAMVPKPAVAFLLLFPCSPEQEAATKKIVEDLQGSGYTAPNDLYFIKQEIGNACGTIALIHALANNAETIGLDPNGPIGKFYATTKGGTPEERAKSLKVDPSLSAAHDSSAHEGQTKAPEPSESVEHHFVTFVEKNGKLYELDGRKPFPIEHGSSSKDSFLDDAAKICKAYMARQPGEIRFTMIALASSA